MRPPITALAWQLAAPCKRCLPRTRARAASTRPAAMCTLRRLAEVASQPGRRRASPFAAAPPMLPNELADLQRLAAALTPADLGLARADFPHPEISYIHVAETPDFAMAVFVLPPGSSLPLHDHHNMHVVTRVLWGELEVREYDPLPGAFRALRTLGPGRVALRRPTVFAPAGAVRVLTPTSGNVHSFHASQHTAVFDLLIPPYDDRIGCKYYRAVELDRDNGKPAQPGEKVFLREIACPDSYRTISAPYKGVSLSP